MTKKRRNSGVGLATAGLASPRTYIEQRLLAWAESRTDSALAQDILKYIDKTNRVLDTAYKGFSAMRESRERMIEEGRLIPLCKQFEFKPTDKGWTIGAPKEKPVFFYDIKGFQYLHKLLTQPGESIHCTELAEVKIYEPDLPAIDEIALSQAKNDHQKLEEQKKSALVQNNETLAAKYEKEQEEIEEYLGRNTGKGGRIRKHGSGEKARQNVKKAIDAALDKIRMECPAAHAALNSKITTGYSCTYIGSEEWDT